MEGIKKDIAMCNIGIIDKKHNREAKLHKDEHYDCYHSLSSANETWLDPFLQFQCYTNKLATNSDFSTSSSENVGVDAEFILTTTAV